MNSPSKYDIIGQGYNTTRKADPYLASRLEALLGLKPGCSVLDMGAGTGNYTIHFQNKGYQMTGVEPSEEMRRVAQQRNSEVQWLAGTAENFNLERTFDGALATLTLHHWQSLTVGMQTIHRHLAAHSPFVIFSSTPTQMESYWLNAYFPKMISDSAEQMPSVDETIDALQAAGFEAIETEKYFVRTDLQDQFLQCGKEQPELYFKEEIRNGISSFRSFGYRDEVENGLRQLRDDLDSGRWQDIVKEYESNNGDYLFFRCWKG